MSEIRSGRSARAELELAGRWDSVFRLVRLVRSASPESLILLRDSNMEFSSSVNGAGL